MRAVVIFVAMLAAIQGSCEAKNVLRRVQQFKDKALREVKKSGEAIQKIFGRKKGFNSAIDHKKSVEIALDTGKSKKISHNEQTGAEQQLETLLHQRDTLRWINDEEYVKKMSECMHQPKNVVFDVLKYVFTNRGRQEESPIKGFVNELRLEQKKLDTIFTELVRLLDDIKKRDNNNKDLMIRLHKELHKTTGLKSKLNAIMALCDEALTTG